MSKSKFVQWIAVDLDGVLAHYDHWRGERHVGRPIPLMVDRVKRWLERGVEVKVLTARVSIDHEPASRELARQVVEEWCQVHIGRRLEVRADKGPGMVELYDDRAVQVQRNTGTLQHQLQHQHDWVYAPRPGGVVQHWICQTCPATGWTRHRHEPTRVVAHADPKPYLRERPNHEPVTSPKAWTGVDVVQGHVQAMPTLDEMDRAAGRKRRR